METLAKMKITEEPIDSLNPNPNNSRTHSPRQIRQLARSIEKFGFNEPVVADQDHNIIHGHGRVLAAKQAGLTHVLVIRKEDLTPADIRAYMIAANKLAQNAGWDRELLAFELQSLIELDFDVSITGFEMAEIDLLLSTPKEEPDLNDSVQVSKNLPPVSKPGDLWKLGKHRVICGDSLKLSTFTRLMVKRRADLVFTDPPYNVPIDGFVCGKGSVHHREFSMAAGEMTAEQYQEFLNTFLLFLRQFSKPGSVHYVCIDWRHLRELLEVATRCTSGFLTVVSG
jgi:hypothetical protein